MQPDESIKSQKFGFTFRKGMAYFYRPRPPVWWLLPDWEGNDRDSKNERQIALRLRRLENELRFVFKILQALGGHSEVYAIYEKQFEMDGKRRESGHRELTPDDIYCILEDLIAEQLVFKQMDWLGSDGTEVHAYRSIHDLDDMWCP